MDSQTKTTLSDFAIEKTSKSLALTIKLNLETSQRKNSRVRQVVEEWQAVAKVMADYLPSFPPSRWSGRDTQLTRVAARKAPPGDYLYAHDRNAAAYKVQEAFNSWNENGREGRNPRGRFGDGDYMRICSCCTKPSKRVEIVPNDRGYGLRVKIRSGEDSLWFQIRAGSYQQEFLTKLIEGDVTYGAAELRLDGDNLYCHLSVNQPVEVYKAEDVDTSIGVDLGERTLYAAAVVDGEGEVEEVQMKPGREFRHYREQLDEKRRRFSQEGDLRSVRKCRGDRERYTEQVTHTATREIVDLATEHLPCRIRLEEKTDYRETAEDPIHDWPREMLAKQIVYKATAAGVPVQFIDPWRTSISCRKCPKEDPGCRNGDDFHCTRCGYQVHADVNAAINIATTEP